ncbi:MAG: hypothetical protein GF313_13095, partial [Caldithrix sp.]|nr:hypothetical protein [Caldithrix sp.]
PNIITPIHEVGVFPPLDDRIYEGNIQARVPIFNEGRTLMATRTAKTNLATTRAQHTEKIMGIMQNVSILYLKAYRLRDQQQFVHRQLQAFRQRYYEVKMRVQEGRQSTNELALLKSSLQGASSDSLELSSQLQTVYIQLGQLLGRNNPVMPMQKSKLPVTIPQTLRLSLDEAVLSQTGPRLRQAKLQMKKSQTMATTAKLSFLPKLDGFARYTYRTGENNWDPVGEWAAGVSVSIPLFNGGSRITKLKTAQAGAKAAAMHYQSAMQQQNAYLTDIYQRWQSIHSQKQKLQEAVQKKSYYVHSRQDLYKEGRLPLSSLLIQENELLDLQLEYKKKMYDEKEQIIRFYAILGQMNQQKIIHLLKGEAK